jgi:ATP-dependent RNA helicase RhlE
LLFSATLSPELRGLAAATAPDAVTVQIGQTRPAHTVEHAFYPVPPHQKTALLLDLLRRADTGSVLVFTRTKHRANRLMEQIARDGHSTAALHSNRSQNQRQIAMDGFRAGRFRVLVATDIAARGLDVERVSYVINFDVPDTPDAYIHRIGRTGRAERSGEAFTIVTPEDHDQVRAIEKAVGHSIERRSLADFDYAAPPPPQSQAPMGRPQGGRPGQGGRSQGGMSQVHRADGPSHRADPHRADPHRAERRPEGTSSSAQPRRPARRPA